MDSWINLLQVAAIVVLAITGYYQNLINRSLSSRIRMLESAERERLRR